MDTPSKRSSYPLKPESGNITVGLEELVARLFGEIDKSLDGKPALIHRDDAVHYVECVLEIMPLLGAKLDLANIEPIRTQVFSDRLPHGAIMAGVIRTIQEATEPLTYVQIFRAVNLRYGIAELSPEVAARRLQTVRQSLHKLMHKGRVVCLGNCSFGNGSVLQRWARPDLLSETEG